MKEYIDIHCHCLFGVDDGAKTEEESLAMLKLAYQNGTRGIISTPHFHHRRGAVPPDILRRKLDRIKELVRNECPDLQLYIGNELYYDASLENLLNQDLVCCLADSSYVLVEFSTEVSFLEMKNGLYRLQLCGVVPILAHVERYKCLVQKKQNITHLSEMNILLQANADGVLGLYGKKEKRFLHVLLKKEKLHFIASDAHDISERAPILSKCEAYVTEKYGRKIAEDCFYENPKKVIQNILL